MWFKHILIIFYELKMYYDLWATINNLTKGGKTKLTDIGDLHTDW